MNKNKIYSLCLSIVLVCICMIPSSVLAQNVTVKGVVVDSSGQPLIGATVVVAATQNGVATGVTGEFAIEAPAQGKLMVSYMGYNSIEIPINNQTFIEIKMTEDANALEDVVVIGYGTVEKKDLTGSIQSIGASELKKSMSTNAAEALSGRISGVLVNKKSNRPGADMEIQIRGINSINFSNEPLYVIDGVPSHSGLKAINPSDIASIDVLKDASSCAIYGSRGANGVVIVTTKGAHKRKGFTVEYDGSIGIKTATRIPDMIGNMGNGDEYMDYRIKQWEIRASGNYLNRPDFLTDDEKWRISNGEYYDWLREISSESMITSHTVTGSGGTDNTSYTIGLGYLQDDGLIGSESFNRLTANIGLEHRVSDKFTMSAQSYISFNNQDLGANESLINAYLIPPMVSPYDNNGDYLFNVQPNSSKINPFVQNQNNIRMKEEFFANTSLSLSYSPIKSLTIKSQFSYQHSSDEEGEWVGTMTQQKGGTNPASATKKMGRNDNLVWDNIVTFKETFNDIHSVHAIGVFGIQKETHSYTELTGNDIPYESLWHSLGTAGDFSGVSSRYWEAMMASVMLRLNYTLMDKYMFTVTGRYDGTSRLSPENRWGFMPSAAIGWQMKNENWLKDVEWIDNLKLRVSYGKTGNNNLDHDITWSKLSKSGYNFGNVGNTGFGTGYYDSDSKTYVMGNPSLRWEMTSEVNAGVDFGFWNNRLTGTVDVYQRTTEDLIMRRSVGSLNGYNSIYENVGTTRNRGIEVGLRSINISRKDFTWTTNLNFSSNRNEIVDLYGDSKDDLANRWFIGEAINSKYDFNHLGIWQEEEKEAAGKYGAAPGHIKVEDRDNNGTLNENDFVILGASSPDWTAGMTNTFNYKNFDLSVYMYAEIGGVYADEFQFMFTGWNNEHWNKLDVNYWTPENRSNEYPAVGINSYNTQVLKYIDGTFLKIQNITFGYTLDNKLCNKLNINSARVYVAVQNPFTFSYYEGADPEIIGEDIGTQLSLYPMIFTLGLNFNF